MNIERTTTVAFLFVVVGLAICIGCSTESPLKNDSGPGTAVPLQAELGPGHDQMLRLTIKNISKSNVTFCDVWEGSGFCGWFYHVIVKDQNGNETGGGCLYAPGIEPFAVILPPGSFYTREIQPDAYARSPAKDTTTCEVTVVYRIESEELKKNLQKRFNGLPDVNIAFTTPPLKIERKKLFGP